MLAISWALLHPLDDGCAAPDLVVVTGSAALFGGSVRCRLCQTANRDSAMTTSDETDGLDHPTLRRLVEEADGLPLVERRVLLKGLIPGFARDMSPDRVRGIHARAAAQGRSASTTRRCIPAKGERTGT